MKQSFLIRDFKVFENQRISLENLTVFAGSNSVGKSTVIQGLLLCRTAFDELGKNLKVNGLIPISLNGPYLLELGNTYEVIRRGKRLSESNIDFVFEVEDKVALSIKFIGDRSTRTNYQLLLEDFQVKMKDFPLLANRLYYLCAERIGPRLKYEYEVLSYLHTGFKGERTFQVLSVEDITVEKRKLYRQEGPGFLYQQARAWLEYIIPGANFDNAIPIGKSRVIEGTFGESLPTNVGFGISYVLPIIVNGLLAEAGSLMIVENPEAHLHPSGQSRVGRFLAQISGAGVQVIIETHSEHVINGIRLAILEENKISNQDAVVNYMHKNDQGQTVLREIRFDDEAEFNEFPPGFIDQEQRDLAEMSRMLKNKSK